MKNKWDIYYKKTMDNILNNILIFAKMIVFYYKCIIINKENDIEFMRLQYKFNYDFNIYKEYICDTKNIGIFSIFNNIPDYLQPLTDELYYDYGLYISFLDPTHFNYSNNNIIIKNDNIYNFDSKKDIINYKKYYMVKQYKSPYNVNKKYIYINIKFFNYDKYKDYALIILTKTKDKYIIIDNIIQKYINDEYKNINEKIDDILNNAVYISVLRKIDKTDILNVFNKSRVIKKDKLLYFYSWTDTKNYQAWFSLHKDEDLRNPFKNIKYDPGYSKLYLYTCKIIKDIHVQDISIDILSNNKLNKNVKDSYEFLNTIYNKNIENTTNIYNCNLYYFHDNKKTRNSMCLFNGGKTLIREIFYKTSKYRILTNTDNYLNYSIFLSKYNITKMINSYGYYPKFDKFYSYELGFINDVNESGEYIEIINKEKIY